MLLLDIFRSELTEFETAGIYLLIVIVCLFIVYIARK